ncbi:hypothetical protein, variant [Verruconis gallopava]|uniref:cyclin-dependent kinase n=1 Tax=Verruconis gallopava TaxID=253628 RepID=A0A0D1Z2H1_9PEZI|nr:hypothetical protein, variant [Verruconis gallopava]KIW07142.1 hypothetical protein, variant [Verruconis gallopava]
MPAPPPYSHGMHRTDHHHHRRSSPGSPYHRRRSHSRDPHYRYNHRTHSPPFDRQHPPPLPRSPPRAAPRTLEDHNPSHRGRGSERWERESVVSDHRDPTRGAYLDRRGDARDPYRRSPPRDYSRQSSHRIPRSPPRHSTRGRSPPRYPSPRRPGPRYPYEKSRGPSYSRRSSLSPPRPGLDSRPRSPERGRPRQISNTAASSRKPSKDSRRSPSRESPREDDKMSYGGYGHPPSRGGYSNYRYSGSPPHGPNYHGSPNGPHQSGYSPQQSPYPPRLGQSDQGYFQQSPPYNSHHHTPYPQNSTSSHTPTGSYAPRGGFRAAAALSGSRPQLSTTAPAVTTGPHVRNLSWTPKTGTRGGHAPTMHGANAHTLQNKEKDATTTAEEPKAEGSTENPFRPANKELRVEDEAGKTSKSKDNETKATNEVHGGQIRFGLPKPGATPAPAKPNPFQARRNPFETSLRDAPTTDEKRTMRTSSSRLDDPDRQGLEPRQEELAPKWKGPKPALKHSVNKTFYDRRKAARNVSWGRLAPSFGDKELKQKLQRLRLTVISQGHPLKQLQWSNLRPKPEVAEPDDPPGLQEALENRSILEEEAYRKHPRKRPSGQLPRLAKGETLEQTFRKEVIAVKYKVRRPQKVLQPEYRNSSVYYRRPGNESVVGFGTYGKVFKAKHIYKGEDVALKRLRMEAERDGFPITAMREMKILKHLEQRQGQGVIRLHELLYEVNLQNSVACFMVFEYMPHDLTGLLNHPTFKLTLAQKKDMARQTIDAIGFMHKNGVLHRDIKAANILVSHQGVIKLADFGLARFFDMDRQLHYTNRVVTIWYRAPELLYGQTEYGPAIDVWAAACVIVEIFTRHAIFPGNGKDLNQLLKVWEVMGFPTPEEWPAVSKTEWYFMMRPKEVMPNIFKEKYSSGDLGQQTTPELLNLLASMLRYDPSKRPSCEECLQHPFFTSEEPAPERVTTELETLGDWHEFESKKAKRAKEAEDRVEKDLKEGPPSCGQYVKDERRDKGYRKDVLSLLKTEKRAANFSPTEPEAKKLRA